jgi:transcriptional regulator with XRE-family HTH domain
MRGSRGGDRVRRGAARRRFRLAAGLSQEALAERSGLSADAIAALERGRRTRPRAFTAGVLADSLALSAGDRALLASAAAGSDGPAAAAGAPLPVRLTSFVGWTPARPRRGGDRLPLDRLSRGGCRRSC